MLRYVRFTPLLLLFLLVLAFSCTEKPVSELPVPVEEAVPVVLPPYRMVLVSSRELPGTTGLPEGMVTVLKPASGRLNASSATWKALVDLAEDEAVSAVVVADAPPGTAALFAELKELRPELLLLAVSPVESPLVIQAASDIVMDFDHVVRAYSAMLVAARMGRSSVVAISMPGASDDWRLNARQAVIRAASAAMGLGFKTLAVTPDALEEALSDLGIDAGRGSATSTPTPGGVAASVVLVVNDGRLASEALRIAEASGAFFIELDRPENGYAGLGVENVSPNDPADIPATGMTSAPTAVSTMGDPVRALIDSARNVPGRPGLTLVWPGEQAALLELGALAFARSIVDGKPASEVGLAAVMNVLWPAGQWHASHFVDSRTGVRARTHLLAGADPYLVGRSYLSSESRYMPMRYRQVAW